jgi:retron-type reverse transcriptase
MKRYGNLYPQILQFENLLLAARNAQKGKRFQKSVLQFNHELETHLFQLQRELAEKTYQPGNYTTFYIQEPKERMISAAPYRDRVVHHALCNIIVPLIEPSFTRDSYANRKGFGTHRALRQFTQYYRSNPYILQCDIKKYFASIDHDILKTLIRRKIKCRDTLWLVEQIIDNSNEQEPQIEYFPGDDLLAPLQRRRGLPIGNLTSQFFANIYLNGLDHFIREQLKCSQYVRYVDDFALFADERQFLVEARFAIEQYLERLRLKIHPIKSQLFSTQFGANFLGFRIFQDRLRVRRNNLHRARSRLRQLQKDYERGKIDWLDVERSLSSWQAHLNHGDTYQLQKQIFSSLVFARN